MLVDERGRIAGKHTVSTFQASTDVAAGYDELLHRRRSQRRNRAVALAACAVVAVVAVLSVQANLAADPQPEPMQPAPGLDVGEVPVWYDAEGLHRGDVVEQTPVAIAQVGGNFVEEGALALVRTGALYLDPATGDVWFHPWGGDPRIVGHDSEAGPGGDPSGDIAVWFEGSFDDLCCNVRDPELVMYDTSAGREIARKTVSRPTDLPFDSYTCHGGCMTHDQPGNGFLQVSAERVVWTAGDGFGPSYMYDARTGNISSLANSKLFDAHDDAALYAVGDRLREWHLVLDMPGRAPQDYPELETESRFSPSGNYFLSNAARIEGTVEREVPAIIDTMTGELWPVPETRSSWGAWSYGDIALLQQNDELLACDAASGTCESLPAESPFLMPTN